MLQVLLVLVHLTMFHTILNSAHEETKAFACRGSGPTSKIPRSWWVMLGEEELESANSREPIPVPVRDETDDRGKGFGTASSVPGDPRHLPGEE